MKCNRFAVFAAALQWTGAVKVASRGTPRYLTSVTWGIWWSVPAAEKDGESGEVRDCEACTFVGVDLKVPFPRPGRGGRK